jgi:hypothetical protein
MVDVLDQKLRNDLIKWFIKQELSEYIVLFQENQEVNLFYLFYFNLIDYFLSIRIHGWIKLIKDTHGLKEL